MSSNPTSARDSTNPSTGGVKANDRNFNQGAKIQRGLPSKVVSTRGNTGAPKSQKGGLSKSSHPSYSKK